MAGIAAFVKLRTLPGKRDELVGMLEADLPKVIEEPGTLVYAWHADKRDPDVLWVYELYESREALFIHIEWAEAALDKLRTTLAEEPEISFVDPMGGKGLQG